MLNHLQKKIKEYNLWGKYQPLFEEFNVAAKTKIVKQGEIVKKIFFLKKGCLRLWLTNDNNGKEVTFQFIFENEGFSTMFGKEPSMFTIESIEPSIIASLNTEHLESLQKEIPEVTEELLGIIMQRLKNYSELFVSRIKDKPQKRYFDLLKNHPQIIQRVPQNYIASYLGITSVSLSRIKRKIADK